MRNRISWAVLRLLAALLIATAMLGAVSPQLSLTPSVSAGDDDDQGHGAEKKDKKEKKEKPGKGNKKDKDDGEIISVSPEPNLSPTPAATTAPDQPAVGELRVVVRSCDVTPADDAEWESACATPSERAAFKLGALDGPFAGWHRDVKVTSTSGGEARVPELPAGRYSLDQTDGEWCRAESDHVDDDGDLVIEPGQTTTVWIFHCQDATPSS